METGKNFTSVNALTRARRVIAGRVGKPKPRNIATHRYDPKDWERTTNRMKGIITQQGPEPMTSSGRPRRSRRKGDEPEAAVQDLLKIDVPTSQVCLECQGKSSNCADKCPRALQGRDAHAKGLVEIRDTGNPNLGFGVYVRPKAAIKSGQILGEYVGELVPTNIDRNSDYRFDISRFVAIDSEAYGNWTRFMNHHCDFNVDSIRTQVGGRAAIVFQANRDIGPNEEVLIYYGEQYFSNAGAQCYCSVSTRPHKPRQVGR